MLITVFFHSTFRKAILSLRLNRALLCITQLQLASESSQRAARMGRIEPAPGSAQCESSQKPARLEWTLARLVPGPLRPDCNPVRDFYEEIAIIFVNTIFMKSDFSIWNGKEMNIIYHWQICRWKKLCSSNNMNYWNHWFDVVWILAL